MDVEPSVHDYREFCRYLETLNEEQLLAICIREFKEGMKQDSSD